MEIPTKTNYPDLEGQNIYVDHPLSSSQIETAPSPLYPTIQPESNGNTESPPIPPGSSLYKLYAPSEECILFEDLQDLARGIVTVNQQLYPAPVDKESASSSTKGHRRTVREKTTVYAAGPFAQAYRETEYIEPSSSKWLMAVELAIEIVRAFYASQPRKIKVDVNVRDQREDSASTRRLFKLKSMKAELKRMNSELARGVYRGRDKEQKEKEVAELQQKIKQAENEGDSTHDKQFWMLLIGGIGLLSAPILALLSGKELGVMLYAVRLKKLEKKCRKKLNNIDEKENGRANPDWVVAVAMSDWWKKASSKLIPHTGISLASKFTMVVAGLTTFAASQMNHRPIFLGGCAAFAVSLGALLLEKARYSFADSALSKEFLAKAASYSRQALSVKQPTSQPVASVNPESL
eukprot:TRINITY_DN5345_c0_g2_i1.p1 TRINITY_DN5345_c0_g2~~TRINITY_DN5345_c0_g2_i1.p1  ORF type:complete len:407 (+),score=89.15 TRINITY_DN5345_c0_g2_i1:47-1267(+)